MNGLTTTLKDLNKVGLLQVSFNRLVLDITGRPITKEGPLTEEEKAQPVPFTTILDVAGVESAYFALRTQNFFSYYLALVDVLRSVLHLCGGHYNGDKRLQNALESVCRYARGELPEEKLRLSGVAAAQATEEAYLIAQHTGNTYAAYTVANAIHIFVESAYASGYQECPDSGIGYVVAHAAVNAVRMAYPNRPEEAVKEQWELNATVLKKHMEISYE
jgi:hypothetical protein